MVIYDIDQQRAQMPFLKLLYHPNQILNDFATIEIWEISLYCIKVYLIVCSKKFTVCTYKRPCPTCYFIMTTKLLPSRLYTAYSRIFMELINKTRCSTLYAHDIVYK